jgi:hypothetical protein
MEWLHFDEKSTFQMAVRLVVTVAVGEMWFWKQLMIVELY